MKPNESLLKALAKKYSSNNEFSLSENQKRKLNYVSPLNVDKMFFT